MVAEVQPQEISTPYYPNRYADDLTCEWIIKAPTDNTSILLIFYDIQTEEFFDFITVRICFKREFSIIELIVCHNAVRSNQAILLTKQNLQVLNKEMWKNQLELLNRPKFK